MLLPVAATHLLALLSAAFSVPAEVAELPPPEKTQTPHNHITHYMLCSVYCASNPNSHTSGVSFSLPLLPFPDILDFPKKKRFSEKKR